MLDKFADVFRETPRLCTLVEHTVPVLENFKPKRLRAYKVPENYREEVNHQIQELLRLGFIEPSTSPQVSPLVCVLKPKDVNGKRAVRTCVDYRYVNKFTLRSVPVLDDINDIMISYKWSAMLDTYRSSMPSLDIINVWSKRKTAGSPHSFVRPGYFNTVELRLV